MNIIIPMAGLGLRFKNSGINTPKPLIKTMGKHLIEHSVNSLGLDGQYIFITKKYENEKHNIDLTKLLKKIKPNCIEIKIEKDQYGAADACLYAEKYINNDEELVITNCDQLMEWDANDFYSSVSLKCDGAVAIFKSNDPKNSFAIIKNNKIIKIEEKNPISSDALVGIHYWKKGKDFVSSAKKLLSEYKNKNLSECYISLTYQYLIDSGKTISPYYIPANSYISLGTPEDIKIYENKIKEFYAEKPKTIFCDIDGTILKHVHQFSGISKNDPILLEGVIDKFNEWDSKGYKIILTTARKESARNITEKSLSSLGICWDYLLMGITTGTRILINDKLKESDKNRAVSINLITDQGFNQYDWKSNEL
jgi:dTDP-glucose pyrophosphorylase